MQAQLAIVGLLLDVAAWWQTGDGRWLLGALILVANWPYTLLGIMPINHLLTALDPTQAGPETRWSSRGGRSCTPFVLRSASRPRGDRRILLGVTAVVLARWSIGFWVPFRSKPMLFRD